MFTGWVLDERLNFSFWYLKDADWRENQQIDTM